MVLEGEELFDEFGNYIGPLEGATTFEPAGGYGVNDRAPFHSRDEDKEDDMFDSHPNAYEPAGTPHDGSESASFAHGQIVLHEDKKYYPSATETFGPEVETLVQDEDTQPLTEPIIAPIKVKRFEMVEKAIPQLPYSIRFLQELMNVPERIRQVAVIGNLHHGKTSLVDWMVAQSHLDVLPQGFTDSLILEQERGITLKAKPVSMVLPDSKGTSHLLHVMDTPGHMDFVDETCLAIRMADGVMLVVDVVEGVMSQTEICLRMALEMDRPIILVLNKIERLWLELKLPPTDAYYKLKHVIDQVNTFVNNISSNGSAKKVLFTPELGNVLFASTLYGWVFSLYSFSQLYAKRIATFEKTTFLDEVFDSERFAQILWGDLYLDLERGTLRKTPSETASKRTFVTFILEPLYKIYTQCMGEECEQLEPVLASLGIQLRAKDYQLNMRPLLRLVLRLFLGDLSGMVDSIIGNLPSPAQVNVEQVIGIVEDSVCKRAIKSCRSDGPLIGWVGKLYPNSDATGFNALVRVYSGVLNNESAIRVLGESFSFEDPEDTCIEKVANLKIYSTRYGIPVGQVPAGNWALIEAGLIGKTATILDASNFPTVNEKGPKDGLVICQPVKFPAKSLIKIAVEPIVPSELPKLLDGLRKLGRSYPLLHTRVEESGEHVMFGTGELYLDSALHDLRQVYTGIEIKLADPVVKFAETVVETSFLKCFADTPNGKSRLTFIAEPLSGSLVEALETGLLPKPGEDPSTDKELSEKLMKEFGWDILASRSVWGFGPDDKRGSNILINDCLDDDIEVDGEELTKDKQSILVQLRESIIQGFQWAVREGPLCEEPIRGVLFRLVGAKIVKDPNQRTSGQIIPTARRACYSAFLTAAPRLLEPINTIEILSPKDCSEAIYTLLTKRRGHVTQDLPQAGIPLYRIQALVPTIEIFGFETDLRVATQGAAYGQQRFDTWQVVPGDPLDKTIKLIPLEPSPAPHLARDFMLKTRRRKGLSEDVSIQKFFDDPMLLEFVDEEAGLNGFKGLTI